MDYFIQLILGLFLGTKVEQQQPDLEPELDYRAMAESWWAWNRQQRLADLFDEKVCAIVDGCARPVVQPDIFWE